jgi:hypothetical protein
LYSTSLPLLSYRPLEGNEAREFRINPSIEVMRTGPIPWVGLLVDFVKGEYKGQCGAVTDVNCYKVDPTKKNQQSGLTLTVERYVFTTTPSSKLVKVDYEAVRYHKFVASLWFKFYKLIIFS